MFFFTEKFICFNFKKKSFGPLSHLGDLTPLAVNNLTFFNFLKIAMPIGTIFGLKHF